MKEGLTEAEKGDDGPGGATQLLPVRDVTHTVYSGALYEAPRYFYRVPGPAVLVLGPIMRTRVVQTPH